ALCRVPVYKSHAGIGTDGNSPLPVCQNPGERSPSINPRQLGICNLNIGRASRIPGRIETPCRENAKNIVIPCVRPGCASPPKVARSKRDRTAICLDRGQQSLNAMLQQMSLRATEACLATVGQEPLEPDLSL